jgi:aminopeptidase N
LAHFLAAFPGEALVVDKWFSVQARAPEPVPGVADGGGRVAPGQAFNRAKALLTHPAFSLRNPNRARSLLSTLFTANPAAFHRADAAGYVLWADKLLEVDTLNPQLAARMARAMDRWALLAEPYRSAARMALERVAAKPELSGDVREVIGRALAGQ